MNHPAELSQLLPCPFCGGKAEYCREPIPLDEAALKPNSGGEYVRCTACDAASSLSFPLMDDVKRQVIERWNRRSLAPGLEAVQLQWFKDCARKTGITVTYQGDVMSVIHGAFDGDLDAALEICNKVKAAALLIHQGTSVRDPDHERYRYHADGADECAYKIRALARTPAREAEQTECTGSSHPPLTKYKSEAVADQSTGERPTDNREDIGNSGPVQCNQFESTPAREERRKGERERRGGALMNLNYYRIDPVGRRFGKPDRRTAQEGHAAPQEKSTKVDTGMVKPLTDHPVGAAPLADWNDPRVQIAYKILSANEAPPNPQEHWEGYCARKIVAALGFAAPASAGGEAVAWAYELASSLQEGRYTNWSKNLTYSKPSVPEGSIRNLRPLGYLATPPAQGGERMVPESVYLSAVRGRQDFREALRTARQSTQGADIDLLNDILEFLEDQYDTRDTDEGPRANRAMQLGTELEKAIAALPQGGERK